MTDKQIIETLINLRKHCIYSYCSECKFFGKDTVGDICAIKILFLNLADYPKRWDMEKIGRIINETD
jgi:hypothetical protein